jgi:hypothetical protein
MVECFIVEEIMLQSVIAAVAPRPPDNPLDRADYVAAVAYERWLASRAVRVRARSLSV